MSTLDEIKRRQAERARAMSQQELEALAIRQCEGMQNAVFCSNGQQDAMRNIWGGDETPAFVPAPPPTLWARFKRWTLGSKA